MKYVIPNEYSRVTGLRHCKKSDFSGEDFYHTKLNGWFADAYNRHEVLELVLDGSRDGYGPSFLDEAIGNLVYDFTLEIVRQWLTIISEREKLWLNMLENETYPIWEDRRKHGPEPIVTESHPAWYKIVDGKLSKDEWIKPQ